LVDTKDNKLKKKTSIFNKYKRKKNHNWWKRCIRETNVVEKNEYEGRRWDE